MFMTKEKYWEVVMDTWAGIVTLNDEELYEQSLKSFTNMCTCYSTFREYVYYTWLMPYKERFLQTWPD